MTDTSTRSQPSAPPVWGLALGVIAAGATSYLLVRLLDTQVTAFALSAPGSQSRLMLPLALGELTATLVIWGALWAAFRHGLRRRRSTLYLWLGVMVWAAITISALGLYQRINLARIEDARQRVETARRELDLLTRAAARFGDAADEALVSTVFNEMRGWADTVRGVRNVVISRGPGDREAVCGQVSFKDGQWAGFVTHRTDRGGLRAALQQDGFDEAKALSCKPIIEKYIGVSGVNLRAYVAESEKLGCTELDVYYWQTTKEFCRGRITTPTN
jgi:hypothetical protein